MRIICIFCFLIVHHLAVAQPTQLTILGRQNHISYPDSYLFSVNYPGSEGQKYALQQLLFVLDSLHILYALDSSHFSISENYIGGKYVISTPSAHHFDSIQQYIQRLNLVGYPSYTYDGTPSEKQDSLAILAYQDARRRAEIMADHLGKKISKVVHIDDKVEKYLFFTDRRATTACQKNRAKNWIELLELLAEMEYGKNDMRERTGQYALWITFELK